jgi:hypothetical protein
MKVGRSISRDRTKEEEGRLSRDIMQEEGRMSTEQG